MKLKIETFEDLTKLGEQIGGIVGLGKVEVNVLVSQKEYDDYRQNPLNSLESYISKSVTLPVFVGEAVRNQKEPIISFMHRSGVKVTISPEKQDIYR